MNIPWVTAVELRQLRNEAEQCEDSCDECRLIKLLAEQCELRDQEIAQLRSKQEIAWAVVNQQEDELGELHHVRLGWSTLVSPT